MKGKIAILLMMLTLLSGCGRNAVPALQSFEGVTVATLQTPSSLMGDSSLTETALSIPGSDETPIPAALEPTHAAGDGAVTTANPTQTNQNSYQTTTPTPSMVAPPMTMSDWGGTWNIWYQNNTGVYALSVMSIQISNGQLTGSAKINDVDYSLEGEVNVQGDEAQGKWRTSADIGSFWWQLVDSDTFVGSRENRFGFCGERVSTDRPGSCRKMPAN